MMDIQTIRRKTLGFVQSQRVGPTGPHYRYSSAAKEPTLYSSAYAVMTRALYNDLDGLSDSERRAWVDYFNHHQDADGLYRDPVIFGQGWYKDDPFWCGRAHLTCHIIVALTCLGGAAAKPFALADEFVNPGRLVGWLESCNWSDRVATTGNEIMNLGTLLQYSRDYHSNERAGRAVGQLLDWLDTHWLVPKTGVWGALDTSDNKKRSHAVQAAYHWWPLYLYDGRRPPCVEAAIDTVLCTQNPRGGFGWGVHNPHEPYNSSACEDIDSIDPLVRLSHLTDHRRLDIHAALKRSLPWVLRNQTPDGGFVFVLDRPFQYGHPELHSGVNQGAMFPTWFRTLSLALMGTMLADSAFGQYPWSFCRCPGYQFAPCARPSSSVALDARREQKRFPAGYR